MSRIVKKAIQIADKTTVTYVDKVVTVSGEKGVLKRKIHDFIDIKIEDNLINVTKNQDNKKAEALSGLTWVLINNMIIGVNKGFEKDLEINGIGYRAELKGKDTIIFNVGYSNPVNFKLPEGIDVNIDKTKLKLMSIDKELLGQTAASIRKIRPPEVYKGKGIKYKEEVIQKKAGKKAAK